MWAKILFAIIPLMLDVITPEIRVGVHEWLSNMEEKARKTDNPWDDMFFGFLRMVLSGRSE